MWPPLRETSNCLGETIIRHGKLLLGQGTLFSLPIIRNIQYIISRHTLDRGGVVARRGPPCGFDPLHAATVFESNALCVSVLTKSKQPVHLLVSGTSVVLFLCRSPAHRGPSTVRHIDCDYGSSI